MYIHHFVINFCLKLLFSSPPLILVESFFMVETYAQLFHTKVTISNTLHICCLFQFTTTLYIKLKFGYVSIRNICLPVRHWPHSSQISFPEHSPTLFLEVPFTSVFPGAAFPLDHRNSIIRHIEIPASQLPVLLYR